jgi:hypothetical protein
MDGLLNALTGWAIVVTVVLGCITILGSERLRPKSDEHAGRRWRPKFSLAMLMYFVTAVAVFIGVDSATAGTQLNNSAGGLAVWSIIAGGLGLHLWQRKVRRQLAKHPT